jgi:hypothetical protein
MPLGYFNHLILPGGLFALVSLCRIQLFSFSVWLFHGMVFPCLRNFRVFSHVLVLALILLVVPNLQAQGVPTVQQSEFRSQWVGEQVDQIPLGSSLAPLNGLGAVVGTLQTPDEVQREVDASLAGVQAKSPFAFKPTLGVGWQISNQGATNAPPSHSTNSGTIYSTANSPFIAPGAAILYDRDHGPWNVSAGYSVGYKYYSNQNYVANGSGNLRNPFSQTGMFKVALEMSRYIFNALITGSSGTGYDIASGSNNRQITGAANLEMKYLVSKDVAVSTKAGYTILNSSGSVATPNNDTTSYFANLAPIYDVSDKTHLSAVLGVGGQNQYLQSTTSTNITPPETIASKPTSATYYAQVLGKVKYDLTGKLAAELGLGVRDVSLNNTTNVTITPYQSLSNKNTSYTTNSSQNLGFKPAWTVGLNYTPTEKTSMICSVGEQGSDIVPELNLLLSWRPRQKTAFTLGLTQTETYSSISASQFLVTRGVTGTLTQNLFTSVDLFLSAGYMEQTYKNVTGSQASPQSVNQAPPSYTMASVAIIWKIRDWMNLRNELQYNSGQNEQLQGGKYSAQSQAWYSISLNFAL